LGRRRRRRFNRHFGARGDGDRLPIFPVLIDGIGADALPAFLRLFQATAWDGASPPDEPLFAAIRERMLLKTQAKPLEGSPFVGLAAFRTDQAHLFFGRQQETLAALACFDMRPGHAAIRWLEINGTSGSGKSSLMQAGLLPLIDQAGCGRAPASRTGGGSGRCCRGRGRWRCWPRAWRARSMRRGWPI
jgi:hypothetical protein